MSKYKFEFRYIRHRGLPTDVVYATSITAAYNKWAASLSQPLTHDVWVSCEELQIEELM